jgi:orotidine-5'-phosphate decarboxylase
MRFTGRLTQAIETNNSLLCVGLDPDIKRIPIGVSIFGFLQKVVDETHDLVCAYKPQIAYFAANGWEADLEDIITYIHTNYPTIPVILDAKRGDIGTTADQYAHEVFERYGADAITVNPYMGGDTITPYTRYQ